MSKSELIMKEFKVLDKGFVRLVDVMGSDSTIVQAARVSYGKGTTTRHQDDGLIRYLMRHRHTTPFEQCELKFHVKVPMDAWRQWIRHRTASVNEYSTRYSEAIDEKQQTEPDKWRLQDTKKNLQGSSGFLEKHPDNKVIITDPILAVDYKNNPGGYLSLMETDFHKQADKIYNDRLKMGISREQARKDLPLSTYTTAYWKIDLHNLLHFLSLRMDSHAQLEIRSYANIIGNEIVAKLFPMTWAAFQDYRFNAITLTYRDIEMLKLINRSWAPDGERLVFTSPCVGDRDYYPESALYVINVDGSGLLPLPASIGGDYDPAWSPDGSRIAFTSLRKRGRPQIYVINMEDYSFEGLSDEYDFSQQPTWSPDGKQIMYVSTLQGTPSLWVMNASDGSDKQQFSDSNLINN